MRRTRNNLRIFFPHSEVITQQLNASIGTKLAPSETLNISMQRLINFFEEPRLINEDESYWL